MSKPYEQLEFTDNFLFVKILTNYPDICRDLLELILNKKIKELKMTGYEDPRLPAYESRGIRMDVYTEDEEGVIYDIEMQACPDSDIAKRSRYYHSVMDISHLAKGEDYSTLRRTFVIFICKETIRADLTEPIYTFRYRSEEDAGIYLEDDTWTVFVNAQCTREDIPLEIKEFLRYTRNGNTENLTGSLAGRIQRVVEEVKRSKRWSVDYMWWEDELKHREYLLKQEIEKEKKRADAAEALVAAAENQVAAAKEQTAMAENRAALAEEKLRAAQEEIERLKKN